MSTTWPPQGVVVDPRFAAPSQQGGNGQVVVMRSLGTSVGHGGQGYQGQAMSQQQVQAVQALQAEKRAAAAEQASQQHINSELQRMRQELGKIVDDVLTVRSRAVQAKQERTVRDQELRDDISAHRERTARLMEMLDGAVAEVRDEVKQLKDEHSDLNAELQTLVQRTQNNLSTEAKTRQSCATKLEQGISDCDAQIEGDGVRRAHLADTLHQEVYSTLEAQVQQESAALVQGTQFVNEVNSALESEGSERARRDQAIESSAQELEQEIGSVSSSLDRANQMLLKEINTRSEGRGSQARELQEISELLVSLQRSVEHFPGVRAQQTFASSIIGHQGGSVDSAPASSPTMGQVHIQTTAGQNFQNLTPRGHQVQQAVQHRPASADRRDIRSPPGSNIALQMQAQRPFRTVVPTQVVGHSHLMQAVLSPR